MGGHAALDAELLRVWEHGLGQPPATRALLLLTAAASELSQDRLAGSSVGRRDQLLLELRERLFGTQLESVATCPACDLHVEFALDADAIRLPAAEAPTQPETIEIDGVTVRFRLPTALDVADVARSSAGDVTRARRELFERCVEEVGSGAGPVAAGDLAPNVVRAVGARMAELDPQADVEVALTCPSCAHPWTSRFDIGAFLWAELSGWVHRTLWDVHELARAYGWSETEILAMGVHRRRFYLEAIGA